VVCQAKHLLDSRYSFRGAECEQQSFREGRTCPVSGEAPKQIDFHCSGCSALPGLTSTSKPGYARVSTR
jgi:hypothetical protein